MFYGRQSFFADNFLRKEKFFMIKKACKKHKRI